MQIFLVKSTKILAAAFLVIWLSSHLAVSSAYAAPSVFIEDLTWVEVQNRIKAGDTTVIIPTGGTGQEGPHMVTGKHDIVVRYAASEIARKLGNALVAPVLPFVPEGRISPPEGHMQFAGTISFSRATFAAALEDIARSLKQSGFTRICFVGDHGGAQDIQQHVADMLTEEWYSDRVKVINVSDYYADNGQEEWGDSMGLQVKNPDAHAGHIETSELMALDPAGVRNNLLGPHSESDYRTTGAMGDSSQASARYGRHYLVLKIDAAVSQIKHESAAR
ncbi:MAG: creatininase family protein [Pseudomonadota bacterium]|nr:creatininase family protein [Pseudomonadota bacterium]